MRIDKIYVENFGTLHEYSLDLADGVNPVFEDNGFGKTTLAVFIKAMFYGLPSSTKRSLDENERKKYTPWQGGAFGGSLEIQTARGDFRIERFFGAKESADSFAIFDLSTNKPTNAYSEAIGEELFGIDADGFERSTYFSQRALSGSKDSGSIAAKLGNLLDDVDDIGNYEVAVSALDKRRRYYVMQGNRGAIAELEEALQVGQRDLEACKRTEEAMHAQEEEWKIKQTELTAVRKAAQENRERLAKAGFAKERNAHLSQKARMQEEINSLCAAKEQIDIAFGERIPTVEELTETRKLLKEIDATEADERSLRATSSNTELASELKQRFLNGVPSADAMEGARRDLDRLPELRARRAVLQASIDDALSGNFSNGLPTREEMEAARHSLSEARSLQESIDAFAQSATQRRGGAMISIFSLLCVLLGAVLLVLGGFPSLRAVFLPTMIGGGALFALGCILLAMCRMRKNADQRRKREMGKKLADWESRRNRSMQAVKDFLARFGMSNADPEQALGELVLMSDQYRKQSGQMAKRRDELEQVKVAEEEILLRLYRFLSRYFTELEKKNDYRFEWNELQNDLQSLRRLRSEEQGRDQKRAEVEQTLCVLRERLNDFLKPYGKVVAKTPGERLDRLSDLLAERRRLERALEAKSNDLCRFIAEKHLDADDGICVTDSIEDLNREERELRQRADNLENICANLRSRIEHFSAEVDRIPEIEAEQARLRVARDEAKANAATIAHTAKFLEESKTALSTRYLQGMQESFDVFLGELTADQAPEALMDTSFEIRMREAGQTRTMESFSRGWRDAVELCVRLSLTDALYAEGERPFLLLDDPLVNFDDERLAAARALLDKLSQKYQILYFVCHKDRI